MKNRLDIMRMNSSLKMIRIITTRLALVGVFCLFVFLTISFVGGSAETPNSNCGDCVYSGYTEVNKPKEIALTFDDVPSGQSSHRILDVLAEKDVPATFFVVGQRAVHQSGIVERMVAEGHVVGNHGFTHTRSIHDSEQIFQEELNRTNQVIETIVGRSSVLYRPPYLLDIEGHVAPTGDEKAMWRWARANGYVPVGADIDTKDWSFDTGQEVVESTERRFSEKQYASVAERQYVFLLHGEPQTADALPTLIDNLRAKGYTIVPFHSLLGMTREEVMPRMRQEESVVYAGFIRFLSMLWPLMVIASVSIAVIAIIRPFLFIALKRFLKNEKKKPRFNESLVDSQKLSVSVLVPVYNEEENLAATIESILKNTHLPDEIIILNDGSIDDTSNIAHKIEKHHPVLVRVLDLPNGGKSSVLNKGIHAARGEVVITIDGDTVLGESCISNILECFRDPKVGAVAGKVTPAIHENFIEKIQYLEYCIGQAMDKIALSRLGSVPIVPGAIGAWRKHAVQKIGGYSADTLVEDQDLSFSLLKAKYKIVYEAKALSYTEVPNDLFGFYKQRFRWTYGTYQCLFKYRGDFLSFIAPRLGWVVLPYSFFLNLLLPVLAILVQVFVVLGLLLSLFTVTPLFLILYFQIDLIYALLAFFEEKPRDRKYLYLVPFQRIFYILVYTVLITAVFVKMLDGSKAGWKKLVRRGSAKKFFEKIEKKTV